MVDFLDNLENEINDLMNMPTFSDPQLVYGECDFRMLDEKSEVEIVSTVQYVADDIVKLMQERGENEIMIQDIYYKTINIRSCSDAQDVSDWIERIGENEFKHKHTRMDILNFHVGKLE